MLCLQTGEGHRMDVDNYIKPHILQRCSGGRCLIQPQGGRQSDRLRGEGGQLRLEGIFGSASMTRY